jgi:hypothetical protein
MLLGYRHFESGGTLDDNVLFSRHALLFYFSTVKKKPSPVSPRDTLKTELASLARKA